VLLEVRCCGVGNWDDIARAGGWDVGRHPPMALGVEAAGVVAGTGGAVAGLAAGDRLMTHSLPLRAHRPVRVLAAPPVQPQQDTPHAAR
jgi:NADPH:quinone reductase-like Zn-dependent oxidoreductase